MVMTALITADQLEDINLTPRQYMILHEFKEDEVLQGIWERMGRVRARMGARLPDLWIEIDTGRDSVKGVLLFCPMHANASGQMTYDLGHVLLILDHHGEIHTIPGWIAEERQVNRINPLALQEQTWPDDVVYD
ncbi:hypothetical protein [Komagataeibacter sp. FNDCF1]|uniref:hypothetical protein n=1 Tax=Komagataeibacter sp. FNDCF1 TaxID=2878681 RepID=UPI001E4AE52C|nr:hypothetical protein [Komagataeibacter sp. FNDCF1]MCE2563694.1 hypothetical protein [Komagataeibacter sp. FNDCF1]